jgi:hypothetical protein
MSNAIASQPSNNFEKILGYFKGGASITENVDTSKKKTKLSEDAKDALIKQIQENLSGIDVSQDIKSQDNDNGLLSAKVVTLGDTSSEKLNKMNAVFSDVLKLIQDSGGKVDKTFLSQKSDENPELRAQVIELATVVSVTKNEGGSTEATTAKSLSEAVVSKTSPNLFIDSKAGLTQAETNAVRMMLFSDKDSTAFAGALTLLQSIQNYKEVAPDTLIEKEVDGVKTLKAKSGSFYKKIERALGNSESANFIKQVLFKTINEALHGRPNDEQLAVLRDNPSLSATWKEVHTNLVNIVDEKMRKDVIQPLKVEVDATFKNEKINQYLDISGDKVKGFLRQIAEGVVKMIRPSGKGFTDNAFAAGGLYATNVNIMNLSKDANSALIALTRLESSIGTVQQRLEDGGAAKLDIPLSVIAKSGKDGKNLAVKLFQGMTKFSTEGLIKYQEATSAQSNLSNTVQNALSTGGAQSSAIGSAINSLNNSYKGTDAVKADINTELNSLNLNEAKTIGRFTVTKTDNDSASANAFTVKLTGGDQTMTLNQENTKFLLAAMKTIDSNIKDLEADPQINTSSKVFEAAKMAYNDDKANASKIDAIDDSTKITTLRNYIQSNPLSVMERVTGTNLSVFFGLEHSNRTEDKRNLDALARLASEIKPDLSLVKSDLDSLSHRIAKLVKDQSGKLAHIALTSWAALAGGLTSQDGETFEVAHSLKQNLFATAVREVRGAAEESLTKMERMSTEQETDLLKVASNIKNNTLFKSLVKDDQIDNNSQAADNAKALRTALEGLRDRKNNPTLKNFAEEFLANSENRELLNKIEGNTTQDKAKYLALLSNLALDIVYMKEEGQAGNTKAQEVGNELSAFLNNSNIANNPSNSSSTDVRELRGDVNNTKIVLATQPDNNKMQGLRDVVEDRIKDFDSLGRIPTDIKENILDAMVKGLINMAKNSAVKLEPLAKLIQEAQAPSNSKEEEFFNKLKTALVSA